MRHRQMKIIKILSFFSSLRKKISFLRSIFATEIKTRYLMRAIMPSTVLFNDHSNTRFDHIWDVHIFPSGIGFPFHGQSRFFKMT